MLYRRYGNPGIFLVLMAFMLTGCGPVYETQYSYQPPESMAGRQCVFQCLQARTQCQMQCKRLNQHCHRDALRAAQPAYKAYVKQRTHQRRPITKSPDDFADFSACEEKCGCAHTYGQCYQDCGGSIIPHQECVAFCPTGSQ